MRAELSTDFESDDSEQLEPPDEILVNRRFIPDHRAQWARSADRVMLEHGAVRGTGRFPKRHQARWRAQKLINLMVDLELHERWELREHTSRDTAGWFWTVEYVGRGAGNG